MQESQPNKIPSQFKIQFVPRANDDAVVQINNVRFTILTSRLVRLEYNPKGVFEDRPSQTFWYRQHPTPDYDVHVNEKIAKIETDHLMLQYLSNGDGFTLDNLSIKIKHNNTIWRYSDKDNLNLLGTARTLDRASGSVSLEPGLLSRSGWSVIDDSKTLVFNQDGWLEPRNSPSHSIDLYFFGYGFDYQACLDDYAKISGKVPMLPRWALGNWWSRYWDYTQEQLTNLMLEFEAHQVPLSVCIIDMDWHITDTGNESSGWTGYTWNKDLFPDPEGFITFLHERGLSTALNLHPAAGVHPHEAMYPQMAERLGINPEHRKPIKFDIVDPDFTRAYFEILHHPYESMGVDFWWIDWQQGEGSKIPGLDPLWWLNHLHFYDHGRDNHHRPIIFSRWGGYGNHRYPLGFSGDTVVNWESLAFLPYFTSTASNVAYGWWSHDIGGHMGGIEDPELYTRWVQFGVFSPIMRLHSANNPFHERLPWAYDAEVFRLTKKALQLRHQLIPFIYSMNWRNHTENISIVQPLYHRYPQLEQAYLCPQQYLFGSDLIVAPHTEPADPSTGFSRQVVWLPEGEWRNFFTGEYFAGNAWYALYGTLEDIPVFAKVGTIIPLASAKGWGGIDNPQELEIHIFAGADNAFDLYEDDGNTNAYLQGEFAITKFEQNWQEHLLEFQILPVSGDCQNVPESKIYSLHIHGAIEPKNIRLTIDGVEKVITPVYNPEAETLVLEKIELSKNESLQLKLISPEESLVSMRDRKQERFFQYLKKFRLNTRVKQMVYDHFELILADPEILNKFAIYLEKQQIRVLLETLHLVGVHHINYGPEEFVILWNNQNKPGVSYKSSVWAEGRWLDQTRSSTEQGQIPSFKTINPAIIAREIEDPRTPIEQVKWDISANYFNLLNLSFSSRSDDISTL